MYSNIDVEQSIETIVVMRRQEETGYVKVDYLAQLPVASDTFVDASCRLVMAKWCNEIADFCNYSRETAAIAVSCLDRFMASPDGQSVLMDRNLFQLAAMTALYSAVKIHEHEAMDPGLVSTLSRGAHSPEAVEAMESRMLKAIQWRVNPPTALSFVRLMLDLVPEHLMDAAERETVMELTQFQVDLATSDYDFCMFDASSIAFASVLNAVESVTTDGMFYANFESTMSKTIEVDASSLRDVRICLYEAVNGNNDLSMQMTSITDENSKSLKTSTRAGNVHTSPRCVSA